MKKPQEILQKYWEFTSFRSPQEEIIKSVLQNNDTVVLLPTGGGKSICFQVPALIKEGICIVISPLISLIQDQIRSLKDKGIKALEIKTGSTQNEIIGLFDNLQYGNYKFLYISPERLQSLFIQEKIKQLNVSMVAIDEAHCISEWGHDFRRAYQRIAILRELHPKVPFIALTATATKRVLTDISKSLQLQKAVFLKKSFYRENLTYNVLKTEDKLFKLKQIFGRVKEPSIVYVNSRKATKNISNFLNTNNFPATFYHGGMSALEKTKNFNDWFTEKKKIIVATNAFGMGIDKPNVRVVIHYDTPNSIENYVQESGRAGRDNNKAYSIVLTNSSDTKNTIENHENSFPNITEIKEVHKKLYQYFKVAPGETIEEEFDFNLLDFCDIYRFNPKKTFNTLQILANFSIIEFNTNALKPSSIQFLTNPNIITQSTITDSNLKNFTKTILRSYSGLFEKEVNINEFYIAKKLNTNSSYVIEQLERLEKTNILAYKKSSKNASMLFLVPREDDKTINRISKQIQKYLNQKASKIDDIVSFIDNNSICRNRQILTYFGEISNIKCGFCDVCSVPKTSKIIEKNILSLLRNNPNISSREISSKLDFKEQEILLTLLFLLAEEEICLKNNLYNIK